MKKYSVKESELEECNEIGMQLQLENDEAIVVKETDIKKLIKTAHQEAHLCNALKEVHDWIDWFEKQLTAGAEE